MNKNLKYLIYLAAVALTVCLVACGGGQKAGEAQKQAAAGSLVQVMQNAQGKTALDAQLFSDSTFAGRMKSLTGADYDSIVANFNTQTPVVVADSVYKLTGGRAHEVPAYMTTILYDAKADNLNVIISRDGKPDRRFSEKTEIDVPEALKKM